MGKGRRFADLSIPMLVTGVDLISEEKVIFPEKESDTVALAGAGLLQSIDGVHRGEI